MKYEFIKKVLMDSYPTLYVVEADVLNKLFFCFNDYYWNNGEIFLDDIEYSEYNYDYEINKAREEEIRFYEDKIKWEKNSRKSYNFDGVSEKVKNKLKEIPYRMLKYWEDKLTEVINFTPEERRKKEIVKRIEYCKQDKSNNIYNESLNCWRLLNNTIGIVINPIKETSLLLNIPNNISSNWLETIKKTLIMIDKELISSENWEKKHFDLLDNLKRKVLC